MNKQTILNKTYRKHNILIGDLITDCAMETNMKVESSIRVGFLDEDKSHQLDHYLKKFDVVIQGEADYAVPSYLINKIAG
jgi:hypothetical protein